MPPAEELERLFPAEEAHYEFLKGLENKEQWAVKYLYDRLNIIDSKTGALLRVNSTIIGFLGAIAVFLARSETGPFANHKAVFLYWIVANLVILVASDLISLFGIFWLRFDRIADAADFYRYRMKFYRVTKSRERWIRTVIVLSSIGEFAFAALFVVLALMEIPC